MAVTVAQSGQVTCFTQAGQVAVNVAQAGEVTVVFIWAGAGVIDFQEW